MHNGDERPIMLFDVKRFAINDGPGIRTTLFMKGCPLRCVWCHNPESWLMEAEVLFKQSKCIGCNTCGLYPEKLPHTPHDNQESKGAPVDESSSRRKDLWHGAQVCPARALEQCGREWTMDELMAEVEKERDVMENSGGGVTLCGGEPLMQPKAAHSLLVELGRRGFHRTVDTSLYASEEVVRAVAAETDLFLVDLKHMDSARHQELTGVANERILANVRLLAEAGTAMWFRMPLIEGINADEQNVDATARFIASLPAPRSSHIIHLLPYHDIGKDKHRRRGTSYNPGQLPMAEPSDATLARCQQQFEALGIRVVIGG